MLTKVYFFQYFVWNTTEKYTGGYMKDIVLKESKALIRIRFTVAVDIIDGSTRFLSLKGLIEFRPKQEFLESISKIFARPRELHH